MKKEFFTILLMLCVLTTMAQRKNKNKYEDWSGDYVGSFSDINGASGELEITLSDSQNSMNGVVLMRFDKDSIITGSISGKVYPHDLNQIIFTPSDRRLMRLYQQSLDSALLQTSSYQCQWTVVISHRDSESKTLRGKAAPNECRFNNVLSFEVKLEEE